MPFALIGRTRDHAGLYCVDIDFDTSMELAIEHLVALGHRRIVFVPSVDPGEEQLGRHIRTEAAYRRLAKRHRIPPVVMPCRSSVPDGRDAAARLALEAPDATAVVVGNEAVSSGLVAGLQFRGITIPDDMSVVSMLTALEYKAACNPPLTVVSTPASELGRLGRTDAAPPARGRAAGRAGVACRSAGPGGVHRARARAGLITVQPHRRSAAIGWRQELTMNRRAGNGAGSESGEADQAVPSVGTVLPDHTHLTIYDVARAAGGRRRRCPERCPSRAG